MIYLVRHGRTEFNAEGRLQGQMDSPLVPLGVEQAWCCGATLRALIGDASGCSLVSSPLGRTVRTAEIIAEVLDLPLDFARDPRLAEIGMGAWDGLTVEEIEMAYPGALAHSNRWNGFFRSPNGETYAGFAARLGSWLDEAVANGRPLIAVSHGVAGRVLRGLYAGMEPEAALRQEAPQDAIFQLADGRVTRIDCAPVDAEGGSSGL